MTDKKNALKKQCPFCKKQLNTLPSLNSVFVCKKCETKYIEYIDCNGLDIFTFKTKKYKVQVYKNKQLNTSQTRIMDALIENKHIAWLDSGIEFKEKKLDALDNKIEKYLTFL